MSLIDDDCPEVVEIQFLMYTLVPHLIIEGSLLRYNF